MCLNRIDTRVVTRGGIEFRVTVEPDPDVKPSEFECYDAATIAAWEHDDWCYVSIGVEVHGMDDLYAWLGGCEWGMFPGDSPDERVKWLDLDYYLTGDGAPVIEDLFTEARSMARERRAWLMKLPL